MLSFERSRTRGARPAETRSRAVSARLPRALGAAKSLAAVRGRGLGEAIRIQPLREGASVRVDPDARTHHLGARRSRTSGVGPAILLILRAAIVAARAPVRAETGVGLGA
jgi:hypothetical protein